MKTVASTPFPPGIKSAPFCYDVHILSRKVGREVFDLIVLNYIY